MTNVKVIVSLDAALLQEVEQTSKDLCISIDQLFEELLTNYLQRYKSSRMFDPQEYINTLNEVYADEAVQNETLEMTKQMLPNMRKMLQGSW